MRWNAENTHDTAKINSLWRFDPATLEISLNHNAQSANIERAFDDD